MSVWIVGAAVVGGIARLAVAYQFEPHVRNRLDGFLFGAGDTTS
jgi:hypothetical protein